MTRDTWPHRTVVALLLVPLLIAGGFLWGTWTADERLRSVEAAVVNLDRMVELNGQPTPLGRQLAAELVDSSRAQNLSWVLANEEGAREGLRSGRFAAVVTIPEDFSAAATSFSGPPAQAVQATIRVETSPITGISETTLGQAIAAAAAQSLNRFLTGEYLSGIYLGFNDLEAQFVELRDGTALLADGASQLADGTGQSAAGAEDLADGLGTASAAGDGLRGGADQSADGARQLADGAGQLATGAGDLAAGTSLLAAGVTDYAAGAATYSDGVAAYASGAGQFAAGMDEYAAGAATFSDGVAAYTDGVALYVGAVNPLVEQLRALVTLIPAWDEWIDEAMDWVADLPARATRLDLRVQEFVAELRTFLEAVRDLVTDAGALDDAIIRHRDALATAEVPCPAELAATPGACAAFAEGVAAAGESATRSADEIVALSEEWSVSADEILALIDTLLTAADRLAELSSAFAAAAPELQERLLALAEAFPSGTLPTKAELLALLDQFIAGGDQLLSGGAALADGAAGLADGATELAAAASGLSGGATQLATGATRLATGATQLATGAADLGTGAGMLADGVIRFGDGAGALAGGLGPLADGVAQYTYGIDQAAYGSAALADGLGLLAGGAGDLSAGVSQLAAGVAAGAGEIPTYTDAERDTLARVVAAPIDSTPLATVVRPGISWASLLLVMALWLGALATCAAFRPIDPRVLFSTAANATLVWRALRPGLAITAAQALLLAPVGALVVGLPPGRSLGVAGVLLVAAAAFTAVNHALAALFGDAGRVTALVLLLITVVPAVSGAAPDLFGALRPLSPASPALDAVRAVMTGQPPTLPLLLLAAWFLLGVTASAIGVARARAVPLPVVAGGGRVLPR